MTAESDYAWSEKISETPHASVFRAVRRSDGQRVVLKLARSGYANDEARARLLHEHALLRSLELPSVLRCYGVSNTEQGTALVLEDLGGQSLDRIIATGRPELRQFLELALELTRAVESIHREGILHKDLKPQHFFVDAETRRIKLIDLGLATRLSRERPRIVPTSIDGTFAYMSPEQTGRMNRSVDQRSDLYSLGVTLYELLLGQPPFSGSDPLEIVHSHIARAPAAPSDARSDVPAVVSAIVLKLLAKVAEDRYQDAAGLAADLQHCLDELRARGEITAFPLGRHDAAGVLRLPQKLYGREAEVAALLATFERVQRGAAELLLVGGPSGVGKSVLVQELQKLLVRRGRFVSGKCDQHNRTPYASIAQACRGLLVSILSEAPSVLETWCTRLREALGPNGAVIAGLVPELELALGKQPPVVDLEPNAAQHRFELAFTRFVHVFSSEQHPLVMFLDDLQWADAATLRLLQVLLTDPERGHLLVLGAYRDDEVGPAHPLTYVRKELAQAGATLHEITVSPLTESDVRAMITDALGQDPNSQDESLTQLAKLARDKTEGNPFFIGQFLSALVDQGLLDFDPNQRQFRFDLARIAQTMVTDNVVDLLVERLHRVSTRARECVQLAACIGHRFELELLAALSGTEPRTVATDLWEVMNVGLVVPLDERYRYMHRDEALSEARFNIAYQFMHDRVRQAAYSLVDARQRAAVHLQIGRKLLAQSHDALPDEQLFEVVGQLNHGRALIEQADERLRLARLNLRAASRARASAAYAAAIDVLDHCLALVGADGWQTAYDVTYPAHVLKVECEAASGNTTTAFALLAELDRHGTQGLDRAAGKRLEAAVHTQLNQMSDAITAGVAGAAMLGTELPLAPDALGAAIHAEFGAVQVALAGRSIASLADLPLMTDARALATTQIITTILPAALQTRPDLLALLLCKAMTLSLQYGNPPAAPHLYASYAHLFAVITSDFATAYQFGLLGVSLCERTAHRPYAGAGELVFASFVSHWQSHVSESLTHYQRGIRYSLEVGDFIHFGYCTTHSALMRLYAGHPLAALGADAERAVAPVRNAGDHINASLLGCVGQAIATLRSNEVRTDASTAYDRTLGVTGMQPNPTLYGMHLIAKTMALYFAGHYAQALAVSDEAEGIIAYQRGMIWSVEHVFYRALCRAALLGEQAPAERAEALVAFEADLNTLRDLAKPAPANHAHRVALLRALLAVWQGDNTAALDGFEQALALAGEHGFVHHEALASELCADFHRHAGRSKLARAYLLDAYHAYQHWGAHARMRALRAQHGAFIGTAPSSLVSNTLSLQGSSTSMGGFDLATAVRMTQTIASELVRDKLIERLMRSLIEHTGAQRGFLVLASGERLELHASVTVQPDHVRLGLTQTIDNSDQFASSVVHYVARSREPVIMADASTDVRFAADPYIQSAKPKSVLSVAMVHHGRLRGVLYLENSAATAVFDPARIELLQFLAAQAATAIENASLYHDLEERVAERTAALAKANEQLTVSLKELGDAQRSLIDMSRRAGMADVATTILHNVGNVLNSVNVSAELVVSQVQQSQSAGVRKLAQLLAEHKSDIGEFLTRDDRGRRIPEYIERLAGQLEGERTTMLDELRTLQKNVEHVNVIVAMQQTHAKGGEVVEEVQLSELLRDAIRLGSGTPNANDSEIIVVCDETLPTVQLDRHKLLQIVLNLLNNARDAVQNAADRRVVLRCGPRDGRLQIAVEDKGCGIVAENLPRIFNYGFTTKPHGHGFGLHSSAIAAADLGGTLECRSPGPNQGATFTLELPMTPVASRLAS